MACAIGREPDFLAKRTGPTGRPESESDPTDIEFGQIIAKAAADGHDLEGLAQPLLVALASLANLEATFLTVFDWDRREQEVQFAHNVGEVLIKVGMKVPLPEDALAQALPGVTRSLEEISTVHPDSLVARRLGLKTYVSVPVSLAKHHHFGMLCGASRAPKQVSESAVSVMEFFAQIIADHVTRSKVAATEKRANVAEDQLRSRANFLAEAEHMLKTPLAVLQGSSLVLLERWDGLPKDQRTELLEAMVRNAKQLGKMIDELLTEARADIQTRELAMVLIDLPPLIDSVATAFANVSQTHEILPEVAQGITVWADPEPIYQILAHLLDNAIKYSPEGGLIKIRAVAEPPDVLIEITDAGVGLPVEGDIFEPFWRAHPGDAEATRGIGLGLHIVRSLVESMGGTVSAHRNPGRGSTFTLRLPSAQP